MTAARVLFVCTRNACRSQMAELWGRHLHPGRLECASAGTRPGLPDPRMLAVMAEAGVDVSGARSKHLQEHLDEEWDLVVTLCDAAAGDCPVFSGARRSLHRPFEDPALAAGAGPEALAVFRRVRDEIRAWVEMLPGSADLS